MTRQSNGFIKMANKILTLCIGIPIVATIFPFILLYALIVNSWDWLKYQWKLMGYDEESKKRLHNSLMASQGIPGQPIRIRGFSDFSEKDKKQ